MILVAIVLAVGIAVVERSMEAPERIRVANTAGTLTVMLEVSDVRILFGAGSSRSHAADFLGRTTRPWDREIDLLIVPGWDDRHAAGAIGLLERRDVHGVAVLGIPGDEPVWTLLEREAQSQDIPLVFLGQPHELELAPATTLRLTPTENEHEGAWARLDHRGLRMDLVDAEQPALASPHPLAFASANDHVVINTRSPELPASSSPQLLIVPRPFWSFQFEELEVPFISEIDRDQRVSLRIDDGSLRVPLEDTVNYRR